VPASLAQVCQAIPTQSVPLRQDLTDAAAQQEFDTGVSVMRRFAEELQQFATVAAQIRQRRIRGTVERVVFLRGNDYPAAGVALLRTTLTMAGLCLLWVFSGWADSIGGVTLATAFVGLFATMRQPMTGLLHIMFGFIPGAFAAGLITLGVLPLADGFVLLIASTLPLLLVGLSLLARSTTAQMGTGYLLGYVSIMAIKNPMGYAQLPFINSLLAQVLYVGLSAAAFMMFPGVPGSASQRRRLLTKLRRQVVLAARGTLQGLSARFESVIRDLLLQIVAHLPADGAPQREALAWALSVNESGRALIALRRQVAAPQLSHPASVHRAVRQVIETVAEFYAQPSSAAGTRAEQAIAQAHATVIAAVGEGAQDSRSLLAELQGLRGQMRDEAFVLAHYLPVSATEVRHAS
ncbi:MAG: FUSC family protein, partial [Dyella sp.]